MLSKALEMRGLGLSVHWLHEKEKRPVGSAWSAKKRQSVELLEKGYKDGFNVGFMPGEKSSAPVSVIDGDHPFGEDVVHYWQVVDVDFNVVTDEGKREVTEHIVRLFGADWKGRFPIVQSGSGGPSMHVYFLSPEPLKSHLLGHSDRKTTVTKSGKSRHVYEWEIELYGTGKNLVLPPSIHPDTGREYRWVNPIGEDLQPYIHQLPSVREESGPGLDGLGTGEPSTGQTNIREEVLPSVSPELLDLFEQSSQKSILLSEEIIEECLSYIHNEDCHYDEWLRMGMALHAATEGAPEGYEWWLSWSESSSKHDTSHMKMKWKSFKDGLAEGITAATLKWWAKENGWVGESPHVLDRISVLTSWDEGIALIANATRTSDRSQVEVMVKALQGRAQDLINGVPTVGTIKKTISDYIRSPDGEGISNNEWFDDWTFIRQQKCFIHDDGRRYDRDQFNDWVKEVSEGAVYSLMGDDSPQPADMFIKTGGTEKAEDFIYLPGGKRVEFYQGQERYNTWRDTMVSPDMDVSPEEGKRFEEHIYKLIPEKRDAENLLNYLAFIVQKPGRKCMWWPLLVGGEGNGKSVVSAVMKAIIGGNNVAMPTNEILKEKYTDWAASAQLVLIEELWSMEKLGTVEKLKPFINDTITIRPMYGKTYQIPGRMNFIANSNHEDSALPITGGNRRWYVIQTDNSLCPKDEMGNERPDVAKYHQDFWDWLKDGKDEVSVKRAEQICAMLQDRDISVFSKTTATHPAPTTAAGENMTRNTANSEVQVLFDAVSDELDPFHRGIVTHVEVKTFFDDTLKGRKALSNNTIKRALTQAGFRQIVNNTKDGRFKLRGDYGDKNFALWAVPSGWLPGDVDVSNPAVGSEVGRAFAQALREETAFDGVEGVDGLETNPDVLTKLKIKYGNIKAV